MTDFAVTERTSIDVPQHLENVLTKLKIDWENIGRGDSPFGNNGASFTSPVFEVHSYSWSDDDQPFNFKFGDIEVSWYKYLGRGMSVNRQVSVKEALALYSACAAELHKVAPDDLSDQKNVDAQLALSSTIAHLNGLIAEREKASDGQDFSKGFVEGLRTAVREIEKTLG